MIKERFGYLIIHGSNYRTRSTYPLRLSRPSVACSTARTPQYPTTRLTPNGMSVYLSMPAPASMPKDAATIYSSLKPMAKFGVLVSAGGRSSLKINTSPGIIGVLVFGVFIKQYYHSYANLLNLFQKYSPTEVRTQNNRGDETKKFHNINCRTFHICYLLGEPNRVEVEPNL